MKSLTKRIWLTKQYLLGRFSWRTLFSGNFWAHVACPVSSHCIVRPPRTSLIAYAPIQINYTQWETNKDWMKWVLVSSLQSMYSAHRGWVDKDYRTQAMVFLISRVWAESWSWHLSKKHNHYCCILWNGHKLFDSPGPLFPRAFGHEFGCQFGKTLQGLPCPIHCLRHGIKFESKFSKWNSLISYSWFLVGGWNLQIKTYLTSVYWEKAKYFFSLRTTSNPWL